jgi:hypothetical protein
MIDFKHWYVIRIGGTYFTCGGNWKYLQKFNRNALTVLNIVRLG